MRSILKNLKNIGLPRAASSQFHPSFGSKSCSSAEHHVFLHAAGSFCKVCARAWLDRGADTTSGTPREPLKSAVRWVEEAHMGADCERATTGAAHCGRPLSQDGRRGLPCPRSGLLLLQFRRYWRFSTGICAPRLRATTAYLFLTSGRLGQTIKVAVLRWLRRP